MSEVVPLQRSALAAALASTIATPRWQKRLNAVAADDSRAALHVAVMREPFLALLLEGRKKIESRFSVNRVLPYGQVDSADVVALKAQSGPVVGVALVEHVDFYELDPATWAILQDSFARPLCADDPAFWEERAGARFATLMRVSQVLRIPPLVVDKTDRRGWVRLGTETQLELAS